MEIMASMNQMRILTVDVEEYYHAENIVDSVPASVLNRLESRVEIGVHKILDLLEKFHSKATFFVLGCVAHDHEDLIKEIARRGHEIASHGYEHIPLHRHTQASLEEDLKKSLQELSDITGQEMTGFRATSFSLSGKEDWFFDLLKKYHLAYDSSVAASLFRSSFDFGRNGNASGCFEIRKGLMEFPVSFAKAGPFAIPLGGGYFRAYPYSLTRWGLEHSACDGQVACHFYIHPWELDPDQPRFNIPFMKSVRHYMNLEKTEHRLSQLLNEMRFVSIRDALKGVSSRVDEKDITTSERV